MIDLNFLLIYHAIEQDLTRNFKEEDRKMYHGRFTKSHYEAGYNWGKMFYQHGKIISNNETFVISPERKQFAKACLPIYERYYPEY